MQIFQETDHILVIPENWIEAFRLAKASSIHCRVCGLEGCDPNKHDKYDPDQDMIDTGEDDYLNARGYI